jgi:hypothetical protein
MAQKDVQTAIWANGIMQSASQSSVVPILCGKVTVIEHTRARDIIIRKVGEIEDGQDRPRSSTTYYLAHIHITYLAITAFIGSPTIVLDGTWQSLIKN